MIDELIEKLSDPVVLFKRPPGKKVIILDGVKELQNRKARRKLYSYYPEEGQLSRHNYPRHMEFFAAGLTYRERLMLAANRVGKTEGLGGYELALHLTGQYPAWWPGRRFAKSIKCWVAGGTSKTVREILQDKLLGPVGKWGTGLIPGDSIVRIVRSSGGVADTVDTVYVKRVNGGESKLVFTVFFLIVLPVIFLGVWIFPDNDFKLLGFLTIAIPSAILVCLRWSYKELS